MLLIAVVSRVGAIAGATPPPRLGARAEKLLATEWNPQAAFFPTGRWWWAAHPEGWGFASHVHVVHFNDMEGYRLELRWNGKVVPPGRGTSFPSRVELVGTAPGLEVREIKLLAPDDVLVSELSFQASAPGQLELRATSRLASSGSGRWLEGQGSFHGIPLRFALGGSGRIAGGVLALERTLAAGERFTARVALGAALSAPEARSATERALADPDPARRAREASDAWYARAPDLDVPDDFLAVSFLHRIQLARKSILDPRQGYLRHPTAAEGRWAAKWYVAAIPFGAGHQLAELRWLPEPEWAWGHLRTFVDNQRGDGAFVGARTDARLGEYTDFIAMGAEQLYRATGDRVRFAAAAAALARNVDFVLSRDCDGDFLPEPRNHWESGMEWQPSYFAFSDYDLAREEQLERVEYACYLHANALAAARALELAGEPDAARRYRDIAARVAVAVEGRMWDAAARFYFSLRAADDRMAPDREIVGFFPPGFGITPGEQLGYLRAVADPLRWAAAWPLPSVELLSPAFSSAKGWPLGPGGSPSMWNGPVWPHALTFVVRSLGRAERAGAVPAGTTLELLSSYARAQFLALGGRREPRFPLVGEFYDTVRAIWQSSERDYFHSAFVDLVVTELAGLEPREDDRVVFRPLVPPGRFDRFALVRLPYHGHELALAWDEPGGEDAYGDGLEGLALWIDGRLAAERRDLGPLEALLAVP